MPNWKFRQMWLSEQNRDPVDKEFFRREDAVASLVREAIQNSLDAAARPGLKAVRVRIYLSGATEAIDIADSVEWLSDLEPHLRAAGFSTEHLSGPMPFITIEDFGTRGLCGAPTAARQNELSQLVGRFEDFFYFWRNIGRTGKNADQRGSWGLGKAVYSASSTIGSMFGWTIRVDDERSLLMGQATTRIHELPDASAQFDAYGFYGDFGKRAEDPDFCVPVADGAVIERFRQTFGLSRTGEPGLSIVIPFPGESLGDEENIDHYAREVIHQYAYPILRRELIVELRTPSKSVVLDDGGLLRTLDEITWEGSGYDKDFTERMLLLIMESLGSPQTVDLVRVDDLKARWDQTELPPNSIDTCRERYNRQELLVFKVPVLVRPKKRDPILSFFTVFLRQDPSVKTRAFHFIRQGLTLPDIPSPPGMGVIGLVCIEDRALAQLLRDAENPAHTMWIDRSERLKQNYIGGGDRVNMVENAPRILLKRLMETETSLDTELFAEFFPDVDPTADHPGKGGGHKPGPKPPPVPPIPPPAKPKAVTINKVDGGFTVTRNRNVPPPSDLLQVEAAFDCIGGNPFSQWESFDFDLGRAPIKADVEGGSIEEKKGKRIRVRVASDDFVLEVRGFAPSRDLVVRTKWLTEGEPR